MELASSPFHLKLKGGIGHRKDKIKLSGRDEDGGLRVSGGLHHGDAKDFGLYLSAVQREREKRIGFSWKRKKKRNEKPLKVP